MVLFEHPTAERLAEFLIAELGDKLGDQNMSSSDEEGSTTERPEFLVGGEIAIVAVACRFPGRLIPRPFSSVPYRRIFSPLTPETN